MLTKPCLECGETIIKPQNESLKNWNTRHKFCSRECSNVWRSKNPIINDGCFGQREYTPWNKGTKGIMKPNSGSFKKGMINWNKGKRCPQLSGANNPRWKGGITKLNAIIRHLPEMKVWTQSVLKRDGYKCVECGTKGYLHAHHIKTFAKILEEYNIRSVEDALNCEELWDINNGKTICTDCHSGKPEHFAVKRYKERTKRVRTVSEPKNCIICGKQFVRKATEGFVKWGIRRHCSHKCYSEGLKVVHTEEKQCLICGVTIKRMCGISNAQWDKKKYCSNKCLGLSKRN